MSQINHHRSRFPKTRIKFSCWDIRCPINSSVNQCDQCHTMSNCETLCLLQTITFSSTNIRSLVQINALSAVRRLDNLNIDLDGNPITKFTLWRMFVIFRLAHFALKKINDVEVKKSSSPQVSFPGLQASIYSDCNWSLTTVSILVLHVVSASLYTQRLCFICLTNQSKNLIQK